MSCRQEMIYTGKVKIQASDPIDVGIMAKEQLYESTQAAVHKTGDDGSQDLYFKRGDAVCCLSI